MTDTSTPTVTRDTDGSTWQPARVRNAPREGAATATATAADGSGSAPGEGSNAGPCAPPRAHARGARFLRQLSDSVPRGLARRQERYTAAEAGAPEIGRESIWREGPPSVTDVIAYTKSGAMAPGAQHWAVELAGKAYGYCVLVPLLAVLYALVGTIQTPQRAAILAVVIVLALVPGMIGAAVVP